MDSSIIILGKINQPPTCFTSKNKGLSTTWLVSRDPIDHIWAIVVSLKVFQPRFKCTMSVEIGTLFGSLPGIITADVN